MSTFSDLLDLDDRENSSVSSTDDITDDEATSDYLPGERKRGKPISRETLVDILFVHRALLIENKDKKESKKRKLAFKSISIDKKIASYLNVSKKVVGNCIKYFRKNKEVPPVAAAGNTSNHSFKIAKSVEIISAIREFINSKLSKQEVCVTKQVLQFLISNNMVPSSTSLSTIQRYLKKNGFRYGKIDGKKQCSCYYGERIRS